MNIKRTTVSLLLLTLLASASAAQDRTTGGIKGKVRVEAGSPEGVSVVVRRGDDEVSRTTTNGRGEFEMRGLRPGSYGMTFRKVGLKVGKVEDVEVRAGKTHTIGGGRLYMSMDEGALAVVQGSVFDEAGRSLRGAKVEIALVQPGGMLKKLESRLSSSETGRFVFKLTPEPARYRLTATASNRQATTEELVIDGAAIYRVALTLAREAK